MRAVRLRSLPGGVVVRTRFSISQEVSFECATLLIAGGFCSLFSHRLSIQPRHPCKLLADYSKTSFAVTKILNACMILHVIWQASSQFQCMLVLILYLQYTTLYSSLLGTSKSVGNLQCRLQDVHVPALSILQHERMCFS